MEHVLGKSRPQPALPAQTLRPSVQSYSATSATVVLTFELMVRAEACMRTPRHDTDSGQK